MTDNISIIDTLALGRPQVVASYLVTGKDTALIDTGYRSSARTILHDLASEHQSVDYLLPTHVHLDHCGACGTLAKKFPNSTIRVHPIGQKHLVDPSRLIEGAGELFGPDLMSQYGLPEPIQAKQVRIMTDDDQIDLGNGIVLRAIWTPGHASHHLSYLLEATKTVFTGDCVGVFTPDMPVLTPTTPPPSFNLEKMLLSLERVSKLRPREFCTPHFGRSGNPQPLLEANRAILIEWKSIIERSLRAGKTVELIAKEISDKIATKTQRMPQDLPAHFRLLVRINVLGFVQWLQYISQETK